jgi:hypothetical protein
MQRHKTVAGSVESDKATKKRPGNVWGHLMDRYKVFGFVVIAAHWAAAVGHLLVTAKVLAPPDNNVNLFVIGMLSVVHLAVSVAWWKGSKQARGPDPVHVLRRRSGVWNLRALLACRGE